MKTFTFLMTLLAMGLMLGGTALAAIGGPANTVYFTTYYSANTTGAPDETLRIVNDGGATVVVNGAVQLSLFASIYVFDDSEELTQCCSCAITPDGLLSESVKLNLTANPIRGVANSRGVIKVISSATESDVNTNFAPNSPEAGHGCGLRTSKAPRSRFPRGAQWFPW